MSEPTYRVTEIVGSSPDSVADAIRGGVARAAQTLRGLDWFEVTQIRGLIRDEKVSEFQVTVKVGFRVLNPDEIKSALVPVDLNAVSLASQFWKPRSPTLLAAK